MSNPAGANDFPFFDDYDFGPECKVCGAEMEFEDCGCCGGEGFHEHEADAEEPWEGYQDCEECDGEGGWWYCPNGAHHGATP